MRKLNKKLKAGTGFEIAVIIFFSLLAIITIYPFYNVIIISLANTGAIANNTPYLLPYVFDFTAYRTIIADTLFLNSVGITVFVTIVGTSVNMLLSVLGAYALAKKDLVGRKIFIKFIIFTMLFGGGLIPTYLVMKDYGLINNIFVMILPSAISTYYLIIMKNYFMEIPPSLVEAAKIDGANELVVLMRVILPISIPFMATFALFYSVERWNEWWHAYIYINTATLQPLQIYLRQVLISFNSQLAIQAQTIIGSMDAVSTQSIQMGTIVVATVPILCIYPFLQKHFVKGLMMGSVKE